MIAESNARLSALEGWEATFKRISLVIALAITITTPAIAGDELGLFVAETNGELSTGQRNPPASITLWRSGDLLLLAGGESAIRKSNGQVVGDLEPVLEAMEAAALQGPPSAVRHVLLGTVFVLSDGRLGLPDDPLPPILSTDNDDPSPPEQRPEQGQPGIDVNECLQLCNFMKGTGYNDCDHQIESDEVRDECKNNVISSWLQCTVGCILGSLKPPEPEIEVHRGPKRTPPGN